MSFAAIVCESVVTMDWVKVYYAYQSGAWVETKEADTQFEAYLDMARWRVWVSSSMEPSQSQTQFRMV